MLLSRKYRAAQIASQRVAVKHNMRINWHIMLKMESDYGNYKAYCLVGVVKLASQIFNGHMNNYVFCGD